MVGDVAGQSVFYDVRSIMLLLRAIFIYVFDLTRPLDDKAQRMFMERGEKKEKDLQSGTKVIDTVPLIKAFFILDYILPPNPLIQCWNYLGVVPNYVFNIVLGVGRGEAEAIREKCFFQH